MEGLDEALSLIQQTAVKAATPGTVSGLSLRNRAIVHQNGVLVEQSADPPARNHKACDIETVATLVDGRADASVWHNGNRVVALLNDSDASFRDDRVTWDLSQSEKFSALTTDAPKPRTHGEFVRFLVQNLRDEITAAAPGLLGTIRALKFRSADEQTGSIQQGRESMGRQIDAEVTGATDLPETVLIKVRRWASLDYVAAVECLLVLDTTKRELALRPLADQLEQAENSAQEWLGGNLTAAVKCPVYFGSP